MRYLLRCEPLLSLLVLLVSDLHQQSTRHSLACSRALLLQQQQKARHASLLQLQLMYPALHSYTIRCPPTICCRWHPSSMHPSSLQLHSAASFAAAHGFAPRLPVVPACQLASISSQHITPWPAAVHVCCCCSSSNREPDTLLFFSCS
jgi:hypothetical protein